MYKSLWRRGRGRLLPEHWRDGHCGEGTELRERWKHLRLHPLRKALHVDHQRNHQLLAVGTMVARVAVLHHGILLRNAFHITADQVVKQHVELGLE